MTYWYCWFTYKNKTKKCITNYSDYYIFNSYIYTICYLSERSAINGIAK